MNIKRFRFLNIILIFTIIIHASCIKYSLINYEDIDKINITNKPKTSDYLALSPFIIRDGGIGPKDYTWAEAVEQIWCSGNGTKINPYIISNIRIDGQIQEQSCISIVSSTVFFQIKDCIFYNSRHVAYAGIKLNHVSNGEIIDIQCYDNTVGIRIEDSDNINITSNNIANNEYGLMMFSTSQVNIISNTVLNNPTGSGISVNNGHSYKVLDNIVNFNHYGLFLGGGSNNILMSDNYAKGNYYGLGIYNTFNSSIINNTVLNSYTGIDFMNSENNTINLCVIRNNSYGGGLDMYESSNNNITLNEFSYNSLAIDMTRCNFNKFEQNTISLNDIIGIDLCESTGNEFVDNEITSNNHHGIKLDRSCENIFDKNDIYYHSIGIELWRQSNNNTFLENNLVNRECFRIDNTSLDNNFFNNSCTIYEIHGSIPGFNLFIVFTLFCAFSLIIVIQKRENKKKRNIL